MRSKAPRRRNGQIGMSAVMDGISVNAQTRNKDLVRGALHVTRLLHWLPWSK